MAKFPDRILLHSGGAVGADYEWARCALATDSKYSVEMHSFYGHDCQTRGLPQGKVHRRVHSFESMQKEALPAILRAAARFGRSYPSKPYVQNLLLRDYYQVCRTQYVFAVANLTPDKQFVEGGTGWAVECAKEFQVPILVFDEKENWWFSFVYASNSFIPCRGEPPQGFIRTLGIEHITGIGSRTIGNNGLKAIQAVV